MKNNKSYLVSAILYVIAGIGFLLTAILYTSVHAKVMSCVAGILMLIGSICFFRTYVKNKKSETT